LHPLERLFTEMKLFQYRSVFSAPIKGPLEAAVQACAVHYCKEMGFPPVSVVFQRISDGDPHVGSYTRSTREIVLEEWDWACLHAERWMGVLAHELAHHYTAMEHGHIEHTSDHSRHTHEVAMKIVREFFKDGCPVPEMATN
jgi:hypothetical protein